MRQIDPVESRERYDCPRCGQRFQVTCVDDPSVPHQSVTLGCPRCGQGVDVRMPVETAAIVAFAYRVEKLAS